MVEIVFTSITKPLGINCDDLTKFSSSEHTYPHLMMEQDIFGTRTHLEHWPLDLIASNIDASSVVLHWPSMKQLTSEIKKGKPKYVAMPVVTPTFERAENMTKIIKELFPDIKVIYGGYPPEQGFADEAISGEGVSGFREFLGEEQRGIDHPLVFTRYHVSNIPLLPSGVIMEKVGCDNYCDFCATSHYHNGSKYLINEEQVNLLLSQYLAQGANSVQIFNEDHLKNKERNSRIHEHIRSLDDVLNIMCFSCMDSIQQYDVEDLFELGYSHLWVGFEDFSLKYTKNDYSKAKEFVDHLHQHGIFLTISGFIGDPAQTIDDCKETLDKLIRFEACSNQLFIKIPAPNTPFNKKVQIVNDNHENYKYYDGHHLLYNHPSISKEEMEKLILEAQKRDYYELGPSIARAQSMLFNGYKTFKNSSSPRIKRRVEKISIALRRVLPFLDLVIDRHPNPEVKRRFKELKYEIRSEVGNPDLYYFKKLLVKGLGMYEAGKLYLENGFPSLMRQPKFKRNVY